MNYKKDYYAILEVDKKATAEDLRAAYRRLAKLYHPDKNAGSVEAEEKFKEINEAYEILSNIITRNIYDQYHSQRQQASSDQSTADDADRNSALRRPQQQRKQRTFTVTREHKVYVEGTIEVKFQGDPEIADSYTEKNEQRFTIIPTEVQATITSSSIFKNGAPAESGRGYAGTDLFATPLQQPVYCRIITGAQEEFYLLELHDLRVRDPRLQGITRHEQKSYGTLSGEFMAYILMEFEEECIEEYTEYAGDTGQVETKVEFDYVFIRTQEYAKDGTTFWGEWKRSHRYSPAHGYSKREYPLNTRRREPIADWTWLVFLILLVIIKPKMLLVILPIIFLVFGLWLIGWLIAAFSRLFAWLAIILLSFVSLLAIFSVFVSPANRSTLRARSNDNAVIKTTRSFSSSDGSVDSIISHTLDWKDRDSVPFTLTLSVRVSAVRRAMERHENMDRMRFAESGISSVYQYMLEADRSYIKPSVEAFDSLASVKGLDSAQRLSMIVSCIQSIPYSLILDGSCLSEYDDPQIMQYLQNCADDCCRGFSKFGVQSPVEFLGDLKGDCDTRALFLYKILSDLGYRVALLTSNYYRHAVIAVQTNSVTAGKAVAIYINGQPYYLWETTSKGYGPGELPVELSDISRWDIALHQ